MFNLISEINRNFILSKINTIRFILTIPLLLITIRRFLKQLPLEHHYNDRKPLPTFFFDYLSKFIFVLFFIFEGILYFSQNKHAIMDLTFYLNTANYILMGLLVLILMVIDYHPWFIIARMIVFVYLHIAPKNFNVILSNVLFVFLSEIGLREKPWNQKVSYRLFRYVSLICIALCFMKSRKVLYAA